MAQLAARRIPVPKVGGSSPPDLNIFYPLIYFYMFCFFFKCIIYPCYTFSNLNQILTKIWKYVSKSIYLYKAKKQQKTNENEKAWMAELV